MIISAIGTIESHNGFHFGTSANQRHSNEARARTRRLAGMLTGARNFWVNNILTAVAQVDAVVSLRIETRNCNLECEREVNLQAFLHVMNAKARDTTHRGVRIRK